MAIARISALTEITQSASGDYLPILDVSDSSQSVLGSTRKISSFNINHGSEIYKPTGTNDASALNALITLINARGGGKLYTKAGSYQAETIIKVCSNLEWVMEEGGVITAKNSLNNDIVQNLDRTNGNSNILLSNVYISGNRSNQTAGSGINFKHCTNTLVEKCYVYDTKLHGIHFDGSLTDTVWIEKNITDLNFGSGINLQDGLVNVYIAKNKSTNSGRANVSIAGFASYVFIENNFCQTSGLDAANVADNITGYSASNNHILVSRNKCYNGGNHNIHFGGDNLTIDKNECDTSVEDGIRMASTNNLTTIHNIKVLANTVLNSGSNGIYILNADKGRVDNNDLSGQVSTEIIFDTVTNFGIIDNTCVGNGTNNDGIRLHKSSRNKIIANTSKNNGRYGIYLTDDGVTTSTLNIVNGNNCYDDQGVKTQDYGIFAANSADYNIYTDNIIRATDHTTGSSSLAGSNNTTADNIT